MELLRVTIIIIMYNNKFSKNWKKFNLKEQIFTPCNLKIGETYTFVRVLLKIYCQLTGLKAISHLRNTLYVHDGAIVFHQNKFFTLEVPNHQTIQLDYQSSKRRNLSFYHVTSPSFLRRYSSPNLRKQTAEK